MLLPAPKPRQDAPATRLWCEHYNVEGATLNSVPIGA